MMFFLFFIMPVHVIGESSRQLWIKRNIIDPTKNFIGKLKNKKEETILLTYFKDEPRTKKQLNLNNNIIETPSLKPSIGTQIKNFLKSPLKTIKDKFKKNERSIKEKHISNKDLIKETNLDERLKEQDEIKEREAPFKNYQNFKEKLNEEILEKFKETEKIRSAKIFEEQENKKKAEELLRKQKEEAHQLKLNKEDEFSKDTNYSNKNNLFPEKIIELRDLYLDEYQKLKQEFKQEISLKLKKLIQDNESKIEKLDKEINEKINKIRLNENKIKELDDLKNTYGRSEENLKNEILIKEASQNLMDFNDNTSFSFISNSINNEQYGLVNEKINKLKSENESINHEIESLKKGKSALNSKNINYIKLLSEKIISPDDLVYIEQLLKSETPKEKSSVKQEINTPLQNESINKINENKDLSSSSKEKELQELKDKYLDNNERLKVEFWKKRIDVLDKLKKENSKKYEQIPEKLINPLYRIETLKDLKMLDNLLNKGTF